MLVATWQRLRKPERKRELGPTEEDFGEAMHAVAYTEIKVLSNGKVGLPF